MTYFIEPVAFVKNNRKEILDDHWGSIISTIELAENIDESSLKGIEEFSHLEIIFYFNKVEDNKIQYEARHPRNNPDFPLVGIFAQRGKNRQLLVEGLDAIDGTPIIDIKPVMNEFLPKEKVKQPNWSTILMENYWE